MRDFLRFLRTTMQWATALVVLLSINQVLHDIVNENSPFLTWLVFVPGNFGIVLPFTAFAGGIALAGRRGLRTTLVSAGIVGIFGYALSAYVSPNHIFLVKAESEETRSERYPFGPWTPGAFLENLEYLRTNPPADPEARNDILQRPANRLVFLIHRPFALALLTLLSALLGRRVAANTTGLSPPARRNARWALGLANSVLVFIPWFVLNALLIRNPSQSGVVAAYGPLVLPLLELGIIALWTIQRSRSLHASSPPSV